MARIKGTSIFAANFEPTSQAPLDARLLVETQSDLIAAESWIAKNYYKGMTVTVREDGSIWTLMDPDNITDLKSWVKQASGQGINDILVVDNLTTDNGENALSARQGKVLGEKIQEILDSKGQADGIATLDSDGKVPSSQLPSYVDDILEFDSKADFPVQGEGGKIYVDKSTNTTWRWGGTEYANVGSSLALGETADTAWAGDKGKETQEHVDRLQKDVKYIADELIPQMNENTAKALDSKVDWDNTKSVISLPVKGSLAAIRPGQEEAENPEGSLLIGQRVYNVNSEELVVTEVGSTKNELTLNSKSGLVKVDGPDGQKTVAYKEDISDNEEKLNEIMDTIGKPETNVSDATGIYKYIEEAFSWYEESVTSKWDGVEKKEPKFDEITETYSISDASQLAWLADNVTLLDDKTIVLTSDIDLNNQTWKPIGTSTGSVKLPGVEHFKGVFDGQGFTIKNLKCEIEDDYAKVGLFGAFQGTVRNLVIDGAELKSTHYVGAFVPYNNGKACTIENCVAKNITIIDTPTISTETGKLDNGDKAGAIAGYISSTGSKITGCSVNGAFVKAYRDLGGIAGYIGGVTTIEISDNTIKNVELVQDATNGYKDYSEVKGHAGPWYGWKDPSTVVNLSNNTGEANITVINPTDSPD